jgi:hypothetical protein
MAPPSSFSTFLDTLSSAGGGSDAPAANPAVVRKIMEILRSESMTDISQLPSRTGQDFFEIATALQNLRKLDAVKVEQEGSVQFARLGPNWQAVLSLLK